MSTRRKHLRRNPDAHRTATLARLMGAAGLTCAELDAVSAAVGLGWCMVAHQDLDGAAMAMVMPAAPARPDVPQPTWIVHREGSLLRLDFCDDAAYTRRSAYSALAPLLAGLTAALASAKG